MELKSQNLKLLKLRNSNAGNNVSHNPIPKAMERQHQRMKRLLFKTGRHFKQLLFIYFLSCWRVKERMKNTVEGKHAFHYFSAKFSQELLQKYCWGVVSIIGHIKGDRAKSITTK